MYIVIFRHRSLKAMNLKESRKKQKKNKIRGKKL